MTSQQERDLNCFFVQVFNKILAWEDQALTRIGARDLSVKELHVLEATSNLMQQGRNTMTSIAEELSIRVSSLTTAVNTLVRKGYLLREGVPGDRRVIRIRLTQLGEQANRMHTEFHQRMIRSAVEQLSSAELDVLLHSLSGLDRFFTGITHLETKQST